jgi:hypothetical protein
VALGMELVELLKAEPDGPVAIAPHTGKLKKLTSGQERFAQLRARGRSQLDAYREAGYACDNEDSARSQACKINKLPHIATRIDQLKREALADQIVPGNLPADEAPELLPVVINPLEYTAEDIARALVQNAQLAREIGKLDASNAALKMLAEMKGFLDKGGAGRKPNTKTPNKGDHLDDETDAETTAGAALLNLVAREVQRTAGNGSKARDITPQSDGSSGTSTPLSDDQTAIGFDGTSKSISSLDELSRAFGEGVPEPTSE